MRATITKKYIAVLTLVAFFAGAVTTVASAFLGVRNFLWFADHVEPETPAAYVDEPGPIWFDFWTTAGPAWTHTRFLTAHRASNRSGTNGRHVTLSYSYGCSPADIACVTTSTPPPFWRESTQHKNAVGDTAYCASLVTLGTPFRAMWTAELDWNKPNRRTGYTNSKTMRWTSFRRRDEPQGPPWFAGIFRDVGLPTGILPLGFAANTTIYAAAWFALFSIPAFIRRGVAARRGLCRKCAYDLRGISAGAPCPECGAVRTLKSEQRPSQMDPV